MRCIQWTGIVGLLLGASGCGVFGLGGQEGEDFNDTGAQFDGEDPDDGGGGGDDGASDADTDTDTDTDSDSDTDTDTDTDTDADVDTGGDDADDTGSASDTADTGDTGDTGEDECDESSEVTLYLSPDDSNSMSSPVQVREAVLDGWSSLSSVPVRTWEFMNYYTFDYTPAVDGELRVQAALVQDDASGPYTLQIGVSSPQVANEDRELMNITLVLDTSGSMAGTPMDMLKASCSAIAGSLREGDIISMVVWDTSNAVILESHEVSGPDDEVLVAAINALSASGGTDLSGGLSAGYELAQENYSADRINRLVLISDGGANAGETDISVIAANAADDSGDGVYLVGVGVGTASTYNDDLMDEVTDAGKGASVFIPDQDEAEKIFGERFVNVMDVAARDVQVRLDLPPGFEIVRFSGEEYSSDPAEVEPQHIAPNDAMVFYQQLETCAPEILTDESAITVAARYEDPVTRAASEVSSTATFASLLAGDQALLRKGAAVYAYAEALKAYKEASTSAEKADIVAGALEVLGAAETANPEDADLAEIREVLEAL
jgi:Ca-activated chloride channel family protein